MLERFHQIRKRDEEKELMEIHSCLVREYGWIPLEEFKTLPIPFVLEQLDMIEEHHKRLNKAMRKR